MRSENAYPCGAMTFDTSAAIVTSIRPMPATVDASIARTRCHKALMATSTTIAALSGRLSNMPLSSAPYSARQACG